MDAGQRTFVDFLVNPGTRMVIPVYQRPYSWDEEQCEQLWKDILSVGKAQDRMHFTGSVVWVQDGLMSPAGITTILVIDGQQRITTMTLLILALARYANAHTDEELAFSAEEIIDSGYLVNKYKKGDDHYRLTLSQGDRAALRSLVDNLENPDVDVCETSSRITENLKFFESRLESLEDPNVVWAGIQRLEIVSVSLAQGKDNPQLIFESMNSTGKRLSSADLIRNYVLMPLDREEQNSLYENHWRKIEETLGADSYDDVFDDFIRDYLTVVYAPEPVLKRDVYAVFKRHVQDNHYDAEGRVVTLLKELQRFARYYAAIASNGPTLPEIKPQLARMSQLEMSVMNPLLMSFFDDFEQGSPDEEDTGAFSLEDFVSMLKTTESFVLRRAVYGLASNGLDKFFARIIAHLNKVQSEGGNYREAFEAYLLNEAGTARRFPTDAEFKEALLTRDAYHFKKAFYLLASLENMHHPKNPIIFQDGTYTIEHIMPQNALAHDEWREMLGENCEEKHDLYVHTLGNLTLTAYNSELSDGSFEEKKERAVGGFDKEHLVISNDLKDAEIWNVDSIEKRAKRLAEDAVKLWAIPHLDEEVKAIYLPEKKGSDSKALRLRDLLAAGLLKPGDKLVSTSETYPAVAVITDSGTIRLENGEEFKSPSMAAIRVCALNGGPNHRNGWHFWREGQSGKYIDTLRKEYLADGKSVTRDTKLFRVAFWDGFYEYCSTLPDFCAVFNDPSDRMQNPDSWASFGIGKSDCNLSAAISIWSHEIIATLYCWGDLETYSELLGRKDEIEQLFADIDCSIKWDNLEEDKKSRSLHLQKSVDFDSDNWDEMYAWFVQCFWALRKAAYSTSE